MSDAFISLVDTLHKFVCGSVSSNVVWFVCAAIQPQEIKL